jgi:uncharacterized protein (DUF488 family)
MTTPAPPPIFTIGYEGKTLAAFIETLRAAQVDRVVDVRALPSSRKKGFSKTPLSEALAEHNIEYVHLRIAGNPYREQKGDIKTCLALYSSHVDEHPEILDAVQQAIEGRRAALLCFERDVAMCHRSVLAEWLFGKAAGREIQHL